MISDAEHKDLLTITAAAESAISALGWVPVSVVVLAQVVDQDGCRRTAVIADESATQPDTLGLLAYATARETAAIAREVLDDE